MVRMLGNRADSGRAKFGNGEFHIVEKLAGIVVLCLDAFLFGNAVFNGVNKILSGALDPYDREKTKGNNKLVALAVAKIVAKAFANVVRDIVTAAAAASASVRLNNGGIKDYRLNRFKNGNGKIS